LILLSPFHITFLTSTLPETMSYEKNRETETQLPLGPPPVYPMPMPMPTPMQAPAAKDETPQIYQSSTAPAFPVPPTTVGQQYHEQLFSACARGQHDRTTKFGTCGIVTAICCFPIGLLCLCADKEVRCARCGVKLN